MIYNGMNIRPMTLNARQFLKVKSGNSGKVYTVQRQGETLTCDCPHYLYRLVHSPDNEPCKHIIAASLAFTSQHL